MKVQIPMQHLKSLKNKATAIVIAVLCLVNVSAAAIPGAAAAASAPNTAAKVSFTFDDGLSSALLAAQTLQTYGYTGTDYIITHCVGLKAGAANNDCGSDVNAGDSLATMEAETKNHMSWADITTLNKTYGWEIGSHSVDHALTAAADNKTLTDAQLDAEMSGSKATLATNGFDATDYASPYGDYDNRSIAATAKYYASHRTFQDFTLTGDAATATFPYYSPHSSYPYNNYALTVEEVQGDVSVATVKGYIDQAKANNQWLILVFHEIKADTDTTYNATKDAYQYKTGDLGQIAAYTKSVGVPVVNVKDGLASGKNIMADSAFNNAITTYSATVPSAGWTTDAPTTIVNDKQATSLAGHGSYDGTASGPLNSIAIKTSTLQTHLFSPKIAVTPTTTYTLTNFVNVTSKAGGVNFYVDEYDAAGNYLSSQKAVGVVGSTTANAVQVGDVNFKYTPTTATVASARVYADVAPSTTGYIDNMQWLDPNGVATPPVTPPVTPVTVPGDANGDGLVNIKDATLVSLNWNKTGQTLAQGDLNGDGLVNIKDATLISLNWSK
jgi:peptidoglycan/xylan/chitin deacetylase (PgdA/CDA1 family)